MSLLQLWKDSPEQLRYKEVHQLIAFAGEGRLIDSSPCSADFRAFLAVVPSERLSAYADQCLKQPFQDSGMALQDVVNELGARIGATVHPGRYRGTTNQTGQDGLWKFPSGHAIVVEVKTTDAYRIDLNTIAKYRRSLMLSGELTESSSSMLIVVGRQDTGDLEAQIRGSRFAWDVRIISVAALIRLLAIKEELEDPTIVQRIHSILIPREFTRLDAIADVLFAAAEEIKSEENQPEAEPGPSELNHEEQPKPPPVSFNDACIVRIQARLGVQLVKRSRAGYVSADKKIAVNCSVSKEHAPDTNPNYWFAFHPHQKDFLKNHSQGFVAFGCGNSERVLLIPFEKFEPLLEEAGTTEAGERMYWHILIYRDAEKFTLRRKRGSPPVDLTPYLIPA